MIHRSSVVHINLPFCRSFLWNPSHPWRRTSTGIKLSRNTASVHNYYSHCCLWLRWTIHYFMLIWGSHTNGTFEWIKPYKYRNLYITSITVLFRLTLLCSTTCTRLMWSQTRRRGANDSHWILPSRFLLRLRVMDVSEFNPLIPSISLMLRTFKRSLDWKDERSFSPLRSMDRMWLISREITKWSKCIHRWYVPLIWRLPTRTAIYSPQWSLNIPRATTADWWRASAFQW